MKNKEPNFTWNNTIEKLTKLSKKCGDCGNTIREDGEIFCFEIQGRVNSNDGACSSFSDKEPQYR
jgi:hypothetical protein